MTLGLNNKILALMAVACVLSFAAPTPIAPQKVDGCYQISNANELYGFAAIVNGTLSEGRAAESSACGKLTNDIVANDTTDYYCYSKIVSNDTVPACYKYVVEVDANGDDHAIPIDVNPEEIEPRTPWTPIKMFSGSFDGQGHTIWGLENVDDSTQNNLGFISTVVRGSATKPVTVRNLVFREGGIKGRDTVGVVVARNSGFLLLENLSLFSPVRGRRHVGVFVGRNNGVLSVKNGFAWRATGERAVGVVVGSNSGTMDVDGLSNGYGFETEYSLMIYDGHLEAGNRAGMILGVNEKNAELNVRNASITGSKWSSRGVEIYADSLMGGFVGLNEKDAYISIAESRFWGALDGGFYGGGFIGVNRGIVDVVNSYADGSVEGTTVGCFVGLNEDSLSITNSYSACSPERDRGDPVVGQCDGRISLKNTFYREYVESCGMYCTQTVTFACASKLGAKSVTKNEWGNGTLAILLHNYEGGEVWGQDVPSGQICPMPNTAYGQYAFKLNLCTSDYSYASDMDASSCRPDTTIKTYTYGGGVAQLPEESRYGYAFLGWAFANKPDSIFTSISKETFGDLNLFVRWDGDALVPPQDKDGCYLISKIGELYGLGILQDKKCVKLVNDIVVNQDMDGVELGNTEYYQRRAWDGVMGFNGVFDGQGHTISGLRGKGLFLEVNEGDTLTIRNLGVVNSVFQSSVFVEKNSGSLKIANSFSSATGKGLVWDNYGDVSISDAYNTGDVFSDVYHPAGSMVSNNYAIMSVDHAHNSGLIKNGAGIVGANMGTAVISNSYNVGTFKTDGSSENLGGLVAVSKGKMTIVNCYNTQSVTAYSSVGGLVGSHWTDTLTIINSYSAGHAFEMYRSKDYGLVGMPMRREPHYGNYAVFMDNVFYLKGLDDSTHLGIQASPEVFKNGYVAKLLHDYVQKDENGNAIEGGVTGEIWGQEVGLDSLPVFKKKLVGVTGSVGEDDIINPPEIVKSSSSGSVPKSSSSSANGSSSSEISVPGSSSSVTNMSSSSSEKAPSSSSVKSSSGGKVNIASRLPESGIGRVNTVRIGHGALVTGVPENRPFVLFDLQGHEVASGMSGYSGITLNRITAGRYYLLVDRERFVVNVRP